MAGLAELRAPGAGLGRLPHEVTGHPGKLGELQWFWSPANFGGSGKVERWNLFLRGRAHTGTD